MCKPTPISEAVRKALENRGAIFCELEVFPHRADWPCAVNVRLFPSSVDTGVEMRDHNLAEWHSAEMKDAADALRAIADRLAPDVQGKALEILADALVCCMQHGTGGCDKTVEGIVEQAITEAREFLEQAEEGKADEF